MKILLRKLMLPCRMMPSCITKSLLILSFGVALTGPLAAETVRLGWSQVQATTWQRMKAENHPIFQRLESKANGNLYSDNGLSDGLYYLVTGDAAYARSAYATIAHYDGTAHRNFTRHGFGELALLFSWVADALPAADKVHFKSILESWANSVFYVNGTRAIDSDESTGHYMGLIMFALAIQKDDPVLSKKLINFVPETETKITRPVGGLDVTGDNRATMRNTIAEYVKRAKGGVWLESTEYNAGTLRYLIQYSRIINQALGRDAFPEITDLIPGVVESQLLMHTDDLDDLAQWGDVQKPHDPHVYHRIALISMLAFYSGDARLQTLFDAYYEGLNGSANKHFMIYVDPYAPRAPISGRDHNAAGRGLAFYHTGWSASDSFFSSAHFSSTKVDHDFQNETNFGLVRNGEWIIDYPRGYTMKAKASNTMLVSGGIFSSPEARGQVAYAAGDNYMYHVGVTGGTAVVENYYNPPTESLHEWTRSYLYVHHDDASDSVIIFDRLNNSNPMVSENFDSYLRLKDEIVAHDATTQLVFHVPHGNVNESGNTMSWQTDGGQNVTLTSFLSSRYNTRLINESTESPKFLGPTYQDKEAKIQIRVMPTQKSGHQTMMNIVHTGSNATVQKYDATAGEEAVAVVIESGSTATVAVFNGDAGVRPYTANGTAVAIKPSGRKANGRAAHDLDRMDANKKLRYFKNGFDLSFTTSKAQSEIFLNDLDPQRSWTLHVDGVERTAVVGDAGNLIVEVAAAGSHRIVVSAGPVKIIPALTARSWTLHGEVHSNNKNEQIQKVQILNQETEVDVDGLWSLTLPLLQGREHYEIVVTSTLNGEAHTLRRQIRIEGPVLSSGN